MEKYEEYREARLGKIDGLPKKLQNVTKKILNNVFRKDYIYAIDIVNLLKEEKLDEPFGKDEMDYKALIEFLFSKDHLDFYEYIRENGKYLAYGQGYYRRSYRDLSTNAVNADVILLLGNLLTSLYSSDKVRNLAVNMPETDEEYRFILNTNALFASYLIDSNDEKIIGLIKDIINSDKNTDVVGYQLVRAIMCSKNVELVELLGNLLLAAQRQEGPRQIIVESADFGRVENFIYFIKLIKENKLTRFNSVARAITVWANMTSVDTTRPKLTEKIIETMYISLTDDEKRKEYLDSKDKTEIYISLWAEATIDTSELSDKIDYLIDKKEDDYRLVTAAALLKTFDREKVDDKLLVKMLKSTDNYETIMWISLILSLNFDYRIRYNSVSDEPVKLLNETTKPISKTLAKLVLEKYQILLEKTKGKNRRLEIYDSGVEGNVIGIDRTFIEDGMFLAADVLKDRKAVEELARNASSDIVKKSYLSNYAHTLESDDDREFLIEMLGNSRADVVQKQAKLIVDRKKLKFSDEEILFIENMLRLKSAESRNIALEYLGKQKPEKIYESIERLLGNGKLENRLGGLDLAINKISKKDKKVYEKLEELLKTHKVKSPAEQVLIDKFLQEDKIDGKYTLENGLGFFTEVEDVILPEIDKNIKFDFKKEFLTMPYKEFEKYAKKLNQLFEDNKEKTFSREYYDGTAYDCVIGTYPSLSRPDYINGEEMDYIKIDEFDGLYLSEVWRDFFEKNEFPIEFIYEIDYLTHHGYIFTQIEESIIKKISKMKMADILKDEDDEDRLMSVIINLLPVNDIIKKIELFRISDYSNQNYAKAAWAKLEFLNRILQIYKCRKDEKDFAGIYSKSAKALNKLYVEIPGDQYWVEKTYTWNKEKYHVDMVANNGLWTFLSNSMMDYMKEDDLNQYRDYFCIKNAFYEKSMEINNEFNTRYIYNFEVIKAYEMGIVSSNYFYKFAIQGNIIQMFTRKNTSYPIRYGSKLIRNIKETYPKSYAKVVDLVDRMVDMEIDRGDTKTLVSGIISSQVETYEGADYFVRLISRLDYKDTFVRSEYGEKKSRKSMISHLIYANRPREGEGLDVFKDLMKDKKIPNELLVDVAMYNMDWTDIICDYIGWKGLRSAIWYFRAHTAVFGSNDRKDLIAKEISKYSPVDLDDFEQGVFDIDWFKEVYAELGKQKFEIVYNSAKYISSSAEHKRAQTYSDAALKKLKITQVEKSINEKRNQINVRAYGVIPFKKDREKDILNRYKKLQKFLKESKQFGAQRQASEKKSVEIAMINLAKNAGYKDVTPLSLVLESQISEEIVKYFEDVTIKEYDLRIVNEGLGVYKLVAKNGDKLLKAMPTKIKKDKTYLAMKDALKNLRDQYSRSIKSFENMMNKETEISAENLIDIMGSEIFYPMLENIAFMKDGKFGYVKGSDLIDAKGKKTLIKEGEKLKVAHAYDLYKSGKWSDYQKDVFKRGIVQPFKQIFRELYLPNEDEIRMGESLRYAGHQLQGSKLFALMKARGWISGGETIYYNHNVYAKLFGIADYFSPSDIGEPVLELVRFYDVKTGQIVLIKDVPPIMFSEIMRDIDLFVSVAYVGGVDPEASLSTVEMRGAIVKELLDIMKIKNAVVEERFVKIRGKYGDYHVHLGSGTVQMIGKGSINILAVHSDNRGKLFLPFVDEDPKTAEIVSKILLLSKDDEIKDATIVNQIKP